MKWSRERLALVGVAVASAVGAGLAPGHPTGLAAADVLFKAAAGAACVLGASIAGAAALVLASAVVGAACIRQPLVIAPGLVFGASAGGWWLGRRSPAARDSGPSPSGGTLLAGVGGAVVVQVALRLDWPHQSLATAAVAAVAVLSLCIPGVARLPARPRRIVASAAAAAAGVAVVLAVIAGVSVLLARSPLAQAVSTTRLGLHAAELGEQASAETDFATAERQFDAAGADLSVARFSEIVPVVSEQVLAVRAATEIGEQLSAAAYTTARNADIQSLGLSGGVVPVRRLERLAPAFRKDLATIAGAERDARVFRSPWVVSPLRHRLASETAKLDEARRDAETASIALAELPSIVGVGAPRRYLVLFEDPSESRASGGVIGNFAVLHAVNGKLSLGRVGGVGTLDTSGSRSQRRLVGPREYLERYSRFEPEYYWQNVDMSPDFPTVGEVASNLFPQSGGAPVDGVISLDPVAMADFLRATGPISVPGWRVPITRGNAVAILSHSQFFAFSKSPDVVRVRFLDSVVRELWHALVTRPMPDISQLGRDLVPSLRYHHLLVYSKQPGAERFWNRVGVGGAMPPVHGDFIGVVTQNAAGNKLDWYLRRSVSYHAVLDARTDAISATMDLTLDNRSPASGLPAIVADPSLGATTEPGYDELYVSVYSPWDLRSATLDGRPISLDPQEELGRFVYSGYVTVPPGGEATLVVHLGGTWPRPGEPYHVTEFQQPLLGPEHDHLSFTRLG